ncbi:hypothetical protein ACIOGZ_16695 [Kitasatospora sp. NPDC088160]|uniref:hypothetical protein n=1 Tax=Kitasatospora sp. NPDC088160 TaxID=3364072 RepID=UPI00381F24F3
MVLVEGRGGSLNDRRRVLFRGTRGGRRNEGRAVERNRRAIIVATCLAVAVLAGALSFLSWDSANQAAGVVSAVVGVAALGVSVYAVLPSSRGVAVQVSETGKAMVRGSGDANTGFVAPAAGGLPGSVTVRNTGDAEADSGSANTGFRQA